MCGISGAFSAGAVENTRAAVRKMVSASHHRGPDASGIVEIPLPAAMLVIGHNRLSIIDLSDNSGQPMQDAATGSWLVWNGEIYNFRQLRAELEALGQHFATSGDTEVLLKALVHWGDRALSKLEGMFAFAFWDAPNRQLLLARDPLGIKPLYYHAGPRNFAFASEVKALARAEVCPLNIDAGAVESFLAFGAVIGPRTMYKEICELEPGHLLKLNAHCEVTDKQYWSLSQCLRESSPAKIKNYERAAGEIRERLDYAVASHLVSDVPVGVFLSGGVDSSLLALLASRHTESPITLLTVAFPEQDFSELPYARQIAKKIDHHHEVVVLTSEQLRNLLPGALSAMDQPTVDGMNTFVISRVGAARGLKVLLTGIGGDELFGGYTTFRKVPRLLRYGAVLRPAARFLGDRWSSNPIAWRKVSESALPRNTAEAYFLQRSIRWGNGHFALVAEMREEIESLNSDFQKVAALELQLYARNQLLRDADVFSMANSVELRVPLLDLKLLQAALSLPAKYHLEGGDGKRLTRRILCDLAEERIPQRRKMGFTFPWRQWLAGGLKKNITEVLRAQELYEPFTLDPAYGEKLLAGLDRGDRLQSWSEVWSLFVLLNWQLKTGVECAVA